MSDKDPQQSQPASNLSRSGSKRAKKKAARNTKKEGSDDEKELIDNLIKELEKAKIDGKSRHDSKVKKIEADILHIFPESWISEEESLDDLIGKLKLHFQVSGELQKRERLSVSMLLQKASGGRALQGIYLTNKLEDQLRTTNQLLEAPQDVTITKAPPQDNNILIGHFSSTHQEEEHTKKVNVLGHIISPSIPACCDTTFASKYDEKELYLSTLQFSTQHVASCCFKSSDLKLSNDAKDFLREIILLLRGQNADNFFYKLKVQDACKQFFNKYGSHAFTGQLSFGGRFWWKCFSGGFKNSEMDIVKQIQNKAISATTKDSFDAFGTSIEVMFGTIKKNHSSNCSDNTLTNTRLLVTVEGGPHEATDIVMWESGLAANNSTWILTDRGQKVEAVWDIIERNHQREFGDLRDVLKTTWESVVDLPSLEKQMTSHPRVGAGLHSLQCALRTESKPEDPEPQGPQSVFIRNKDAHGLFIKLDLCKHYPIGLQLKDALCVRSGEFALNQTHLVSLKDLPYLILQKLMAYDHRCRSELMSIKSRDKECSDEWIHPVDSLLAVLICSDNFLRQDLFSRLAKCQLAVPFILPDPFTQQLSLPLWAMRSIIKDWRCIESTGSEVKVVEKTCPITNYKMPIISFMRFGARKKRMRGALSKSKILNDVIGESHYFFHHDLADGQSEVLLGKGLVDMCWYLSSGKTTDIFPDAVTFLNLHGDARDYPRQSRFLSKISSMCFILLIQENLQIDGETIKILKEFSSSAGGITILNDTEISPAELQTEIPEMSIIDLKEFASSAGGINDTEISPAELQTEIPEMSIIDLKEFASSAGGINDTEISPAGLQTKLPEMSIIDLTDKNASQIKSLVQVLINKRFQAFNDLKTLEDHCKCNPSAAAVKDCNIFIDKECDSFKEGYDLAKGIHNMVTSYKAKQSSTREELLPLQGVLWRTWATKDKELYRQFNRGNKLVNIYTDEVKEEKRVLRQGQLKYVESLTPVMEAFVTTLLKLEGPSNRIVRNYFLQCLKLGLNDFSRDQISALQQQYRSAQMKLSTIQANSNTFIYEGGKEVTEELIRLMHGKIDDVQDQLIQASFGLEHLFRELGQIYESALELSSIPNLSRLPEAVAELLIEGYPLELMDGDAAHVPLRWVTSVIMEVATKLGDPKVFVLSVLGVQGTGKSTMLNTVFGLQFNVSSGRCTRGAFMQLLPLDEQLKTQTGFSFVLIVDTEGLRAPELDYLKTQKHDNELATFVIGLANMTLINIYGEVPGDMDDILQTSVHAFLRMSQVMKYRKGCQFVHQNAESGRNAEVGRRNFTQKLNRFTAHAAKEANVEGQYVTFNDVIKFNDLNDVHHFPGLWKGDPPMAPINTGYSEAAQNLKYHLIKILQESKDGDHHLSSFRDKVSDLWEALLKENFVFSFKNTLEITAYNLLETQYSQWEWEFRAEMLNWERTEGNEIATADMNTVSKLVSEKSEELNEHIKKLYEVCKSEMDKFFSDSKQSEILVQWKARFEAKLKNLSAELKTHAANHCKRLGISRKVEKEQNIYIKRMTENGVQEVVQSLKQKQDRLHANIRSKMLEPSQLSTILSFDLFTPDHLKQYREKAMITAAEEDSLLQIVQNSGGSLTEQYLNDNIMVGGILTTEQIIKILNQSEQEMATEFDSYWDDMLKELPYEPEEPVNVEEAVENVLIDYVKGYDSQSLDELKISLKKRGASLELAVKEKEHYILYQQATKTDQHNITDDQQATDWQTTKTDWLATKTITDDWQATKTIEDWQVITDDQQTITDDKQALYHQIEAQRITDDVLGIARSHVESTAALKGDFNTIFTLELLRKLDSEIDTHSSGCRQHFIFTQKYKSDIYLSACAYAVIEFEKMAESFRTKNDPQLIEIKAPYFTIFRNQFYQEGIANTLCAHFDGPIRTQVRKSLSRTIVGQMKSSEYHYFKSKMALKVKILTDLYHENNFDSYMVYVTNVEKCLEEKLKDYTIKYCDEEVPGLKNTRLQILAKEEVSRLIEIVVTESEADITNIMDWLKAFCENIKIRRELGIKFKVSDIINSEVIQELNLEDLKCLIRERIKNSEENLHATFGEIECKNEMENWEVKPHEFLKELVGCTEQCPLCGEQCDLQGADHLVNHHTAVHRSGCLAGYRDVHTKIMDAEFCPAKVSCTLKFRNVVTNNKWVDYSKYHNMYPKWTISPDASSGDCLYWKLFIGRYKDQIARRYNAEPPSVPDNWSMIEWEEVEANLKEIYKYA